jgi:hypothetical protein
MTTAESMHRRPARGGIEVDAFDRASQRAYAWKPGERAAVKTGYSRRTRRAARAGLAALTR